MSGSASIRSKEGGLIRELSLAFILPAHSFSPATSTSRGCTQLSLARDSIVCYRTGGVTGERSIVYDFYFLAATWTVHAKKLRLRDLTVRI